jgi:hypothetical protein
MVDLSAATNELQQARQARIAAEAAIAEVEDFTSRLRQFRPGRQCLVVVVAGEPELPQAPN